LKRFFKISRKGAKERKVRKGFSVRETIIIVVFEKVELKLNKGWSCETPTSYLFVLRRD